MRAGWLASLLLLGSLVGSLLGTACGGGSPSTPDGGVPHPDAAPVAHLMSISISPPSHTFVVIDNAPLSAPYHAYGLYDDGTTKDISDSVIWSVIDASVITIGLTGQVTTSTQLGGKTMVQATKGALIGQGDVTVIQRHVVIGTGVPADAGNQFDMAALDGAPGRAPSIAYPSDGTVLPPNFPGLEFQFFAGQGNAIYELAITSSDYQEIRQYETCHPTGTAGTCVITPALDTWTILGHKFTGKDVSVTVTGLSSTTPATKAASSDRTIRFIGEDLTAGLYYWAASAGALYRFDFGHSGVPPELFYSAPAGSSCVGCHALSRDGSLAAIGIDSPQPSGLHVVDVATHNILWQVSPGPQGSNYHAFSPDDSMLLTADGSTLEVRDAMTGTVEPFGNLAAGALFPDWSPDGGMIVYTKTGGGGLANFTTPSGTIAVRPWDMGTATFGAESTVVLFNGALNNYYPAFTPDSLAIVFNRTDGAGGNGLDSYNNQACTLWSVPVAGGTPVELAAADGGTIGNTWPKVAPSWKPYTGGNVTFITFTSRRPIGIRPASGTSQIWMAAYDPARAAMGLDPSFPAVHLPWQDTASANHIAQWATHVPHEPCGPMGECPTGEFCQDGDCVPNPG